MIFHYGVTQQGAYHIQKNIVCQDFHCYKKINEDFSIAAVADGLGSESHSDIASKIAVEKSIEYCLKNVNFEKEEDICSIIKASFRFALDFILKTAKNNGDDENQYDTTLALAIFGKGKVFFGNSGDSGIIVLNCNGEYEAITEQQRDEDGRVFPLWFGEEKWVFGTKYNIAGVLLATDGIFETFFPFLLRTADVKIYVALVHYVMSEESLCFSSEGEENVQNRMESFIASIPENQVNDDKTILVMLDSEIKSSKRESQYYESPNWELLKKKHQEEYRRAAYPNLYAQKNEEIKNDGECDKTEGNCLSKEENNVFTEEKESKKKLILNKIKKMMSSEKEKNNE